MLNWRSLTTMTPRSPRLASSRPSAGRTIWWRGWPGGVVRSISPARNIPARAYARSPQSASVAAMKYFLRHQQHSPANGDLSMPGTALTIAPLISRGEKCLSCRQPGWHHRNCKCEGNPHGIHRRLRAGRPPPGKSRAVQPRQGHRPCSTWPANRMRPRIPARIGGCAVERREFCRIVKSTAWLAL